MMKNSARWKRDERKRMRDAGYVLRQFWVHPEDWPKVLKYLKTVRARRDKETKS